MALRFEYAGVVLANSCEVDGVKIHQSSDGQIVFENDRGTPVKVHVGLTEQHEPEVLEEIPHGGFFCKTLKAGEWEVSIRVPCIQGDGYGEDDEAPWEVTEQVFQILHDNGICPWDSESMVNEYELDLIVSSDTIADV